MLTNRQQDFLHTLLEIDRATYRGVFWSGAMGRGKTHLVTWVKQQYRDGPMCLPGGIVSNARTVMVPVYHETIPNLAAIWRAYGGAGDMKQKQEEIGHMVRSRIIILEEFGREPEQFIDATKEILDVALEKTNAIVIGVSNFGWPQLQEKYDESVLWRISKKLLWHEWRKETDAMIADPGVLRQELEKARPLNAEYLQRKLHALQHDPRLDR